MLSLFAGTAPRDLKGKIAEVWHEVLEPQAIADGVPAPVVAFLRERMLANSPTGLTTMAGHLLAAADKTGELAGRGIPTLVLYGADDNAWPPGTQAEMAAALRAEQVRLPGAAHSPGVEAPGATAQALTSFWNAVEAPGGNGGTGSPPGGSSETSQLR
jgi:pimeloyl-ACP methyl ester carboxylesterase